MGSKARDNRHERKNRDLSQFGFFDIGDGDLGQDEEFEAELNMLMGDGGNKKPKGSKSKKPMVSMNELDSMVSACMQDVPEDIDVNVEGEDVDLLDELNDIISDADEDEDSAPRGPPPIHVSAQEPIYQNNNVLSLVESRMPMYEQAVNVAKNSGDLSRARRYGRGLDALKDFKRRIENGKPIDEADIPPALSESFLKPKETPQPLPASREEPRPTTHKHNSEDDVLAQFRQKREIYKKEALAAKAQNNREGAIEGLRKVKAIDALIEKHKLGESISLDDLPNVKKDSVTRQFSRETPITLPDNPDDIPPADPSLFGAPPPADSVLGALNQRLERYLKDEEKAKIDGNASKARRLGRICKQYKDAIKNHKAGKPVPVDDLPTPPGFSPIPIAAPLPSKVSSAVQKPSEAPPKVSGKTHSIQDKQLRTLLQRQNMFKSAALEAKRAGQMDQAKEYLRQYKGFDNLIEASRGGIPVDLNTLPVPPQMKEEEPVMDFEIISRQESQDEGQTRQELFLKLEEELSDQIKMCKANRQHFKLTGDIASSNKFHQMETHSLKDLKAIRSAFERGDPVPRFHYEIRSFSKVQCNTDLTDNEIELSILQGTNFPGDKSIDTYVRYEFPYPKNDPYKDKTPYIKDDNNPNFEHSVSIPINVKERSCQRIFKRHSVKCEVYVRGGLFRSDVLLGTALAKLQHLENHCTLHECYPLMDGRKAVGGTLEIKVRLRNPVLTKQVEKVQEKWLVISF